MIYLNGFPVKPTIFPDKTSQVWKLPEELFHDPIYTIKWVFESEDELLHVAQTRFLIPQLRKCDLDMPYLPYARQDKSVDNESCFALRPFATLINSLKFNRITTFDAHSIECLALIDRIYIQYPYKKIMEVFNDECCDIICYPDQGAKLRYSPVLTKIPCFFADKVRDPISGNIVGMKLQNFGHTIENKRILIVDDICDGGATFISLAKLLEDANVMDIILYVSHGIFSKGVKVLYDAGISRIYTKDGFVK